MASPQNITLLRARHTLAALCLALAAVTGLAATSTDYLVETGFDLALRQSPASPAQQRTSLAQQPVAGSEEFWLMQAGYPSADRDAAVTFASWTTPVKLGAKLSLTIGRQTRSYEVIDISALPAGITRVVSENAGGTLVMVSLREAGHPHGDGLRFVIDTSASSPRMAAPPRTL